jgi:hypothetical protein
MLLYLDDDSVKRQLVRLLSHAGHDVRVPADVGLAGRHDAVHLRHAIQARRACLTHNYEDFEELHELMQAGGGQHFGIIVIRRDGDPKKNLRGFGIVRAIERLMTSGVPIPNRYHVLNQWR